MPTGPRYTTTDIDMLLQDIKDLVGDAASRMPASSQSRPVLQEAVRKATEAQAKLSSLAILDRATQLLADVCMRWIWKEQLVSEDPIDEDQLKEANEALRVSLDALASHRDILSDQEGYDKRLARALQEERGGHRIEFCLRKNRNKFGDKTRKDLPSTFMHFLEEVDELIEGMHQWDTGKNPPVPLKSSVYISRLREDPLPEDEIKSMVADVVYLADAIAQIHGLELHECLVRKLIVNLGRTWETQTATDMEGTKYEIIRAVNRLRPGNSGGTL